MQYIFFKNILETILANYLCPQCQSKANEQSLSIMGVRENSLSIHVHCHICGTHSELNAEVNAMAAQMLETEEWRKTFEEFVKSWWTIGATMKNKNPRTPVNPDVIKDEDIVKIHNDLKNAKSIEDLMN